MTQGMEKKEVESIRVEFETKDMPKELYFGFIRYRLREYLPKPTRCFKCLTFGQSNIML